MNYGKAIRIIRSVRGFSQQELGNSIGVDGSYISRLEAGNRKPSTSTLEKIADELSVPLFLLVLMASEDSNLIGASPSVADKIARELLHVLLHAESQTNE
jgi:transcriptional regulator with XRE-family HTH domain